MKDFLHRTPLSTFGMLPYPSALGIPISPEREIRDVLSIAGLAAIAPLRSANAARRPHTTTPKRTLKPYLKYKDSGVDFLGKIPNDWSIARASRLFSERRAVGVVGLPILEVSISRGVQVRDFQDGSRKQVMSEVSGYQLARKGDVAYNMMRAWQGAIGIVPTDGLVSPAYVVAIPNGEIVGRYFNRLTKTQAYLGEIDARSRGIVPDRNRLYWDQFKQLSIVLPSLVEQQAIADFLDVMDAKISRFIAVKRRMIALLEEQKQAIINQAVTRGLDPNIPLKPSGIDWLGDIPAHWEAIPTGVFLKRRSQTVGARSVDYLLLSLTLKGVVPRDLDNPHGKFPASFDTYQAVEPNDLIFCLFDMDETPRCVGFSDHSGMITGAYTVLRCSEASLGAFIYRFFLAMDQQKRLRPFYSGLRKVIPLGRFLSIKIPIPPEKERDEIVAELETLEADTSATIKRLRHEMELIQEYRTRLISDVVTGKLDVRCVELPALEEVVDAQLDFDDAERPDVDGALPGEDDEQP